MAALTAAESLKKGGLGRGSISTTTGMHVRTSWLPIRRIITTG